MMRTLRELHRLLDKHGHHGQAEYVLTLSDLPADSPKLEASLQSVEMWGGSGAVWEVGELGDDKRQFRNTIIQLVEEMERSGIHFPRARFIANTFLKWNRDGV